MANFNTMRDRLRADYNHSFVCNIEKGSRLILSYNWGKKGGVIERIEAYVSGTNPFTGKALEKEEYMVVFGPANMNASMRLGLYGDYVLHFTAHTCKGEKIEDFAQHSFGIYNEANRPFIRYSLNKVEKGWMKLTVSSNCYRRVKGKLWFSCGGHMQRLPDKKLTDQLNITAAFLVAASQDGGELVIADQELMNSKLKPERI